MTYISTWWPTSRHYDLHLNTRFVYWTPAIYPTSSAMTATTNVEMTEVTTSETIAVYFSARISDCPGVYYARSCRRDPERRRPVHSLYNRLAWKSCRRHHQPTGCNPCPGRCSGACRDPRWSWIQARSGSGPDRCRSTDPRNRNRSRNESPCPDPDFLLVQLL